MILLARKVRAAAQQFWRRQNGTAAVEFALILPVMLFVYLGSVEASSLITMDRKVQSVSGALGDLVARVDGKLTTASLENYFRAASGIMTPYPADDVRQEVIALTVEDGAAEVAWAYRYDDGEAIESDRYSKGDEYPLPDEMIAIADEDMVIAAEASYSYPPMFGFIYTQPINLFRSSFFMPRFGENIAEPS